MASYYLRKAVEVVGTPFVRTEYSASLFLSPRMPSMGTPLAINMLPYLKSSAADMPILAEGKPLHVFFFGTITFHEMLHKYVNQLLRKQPSTIVAGMQEPLLFERHLHVFVLQKRVFEALGMIEQLEAVGRQEASHGPDYVRAWARIHGDADLEQRLFEELL